MNAIPVSSNWVANLRQVGWSKAAELAKVAGPNGEHFDCAKWLHKAEQMPMQQFKDEVQKYLTGESEPPELIFFKDAGDGQVADIV